MPTMHPNILWVQQDSTLIILEKLDDSCVPTVCLPVHIPGDCESMLLAAAQLACCRLFVIAVCSRTAAERALIWGKATGCTGKVHVV